MNKFSWFIIGYLGFSFSAGATDLVVTATHGLNLRTGPGTDYEVITKVVCDEVVTEIEYVTSSGDYIGWYKVRTKAGSLGWLCAGKGDEIWVTRNGSGEEIKPVSGGDAVRSRRVGKIEFNVGTPKFKKEVRAPKFGEGWFPSTREEYWWFSTDIYFKNCSDEIIEYLYFYTKVTKEVCFGKKIFGDFRGRGGETSSGIGEALVTVPEDGEADSEVIEEAKFMKPGDRVECVVDLYEIRKTEAEKYEWTSATVELYYKAKCIGVENETPALFICEFEVFRK